MRNEWERSGRPGGAVAEGTGWGRSEHVRGRTVTVLLKAGLAPSHTALAERLLDDRIIFEER